MSVARLPSAAQAFADGGGPVEKTQPCKPRSTVPPYATLHTKGHDVGVGVGKKRFDGGPPLNMTHVDGPHGFVGMMQGTEQGLEYTRFNKGFDRRNQAKIGQDVERKEHERLQAEKKVVTDQLRTDRLVEIKDYNGFDVISGQYDPSKIRGAHPRARHLSDRPSKELAKTGEITIRNSCYRMYTAAPTGDKHDYRQHQLVSEGQSKPKFTSVLGIGRAEEPSYGVEDQFAKSQYGGKVHTDFGLCEVREPGRYTPRKLGGSAAKPQMIFGGAWRDEDLVPK